MGRIYAILTDALGKPVYSEIYPEKTATTVSVWIIGFLVTVQADLDCRRNMDA